MYVETYIYIYILKGLHERGREAGERDADAGVREGLREGDEGTV